MNEPSPENGNGGEEQPKPNSYGTPFESGPPTMAEYNWELQREQTWHRNAAHLAATGCSMHKIGRLLGKAYQTISNLFRQKFFQQMIREELAASQRDIRELFRNELISNLAVLAEIRDDPNAPANSRVLSVKEICDRALGRPVQPIESNEKQLHSDDPWAEVQKLEAEVDRMYAQRHGLTPRLPSSEESHAGDK